MRAGKTRVHARLELGHGFAGLVQQRIKILREVAQQLHPVFAPLGHLIQPFLHARREARVHEPREMLQKQVADNDAQIRGQKLPVLYVDIITLGQGGDDGRIGGRPADAQFFEFVHQGRFGESGRRLGEFLFLAQLFQTQFLPLPQFGQSGRVRFLRGGNAQKSRKDELLALGPPLGRAALDGHHRIPEAGRCRLGRHEPLPDEAVEPVLFRRERAFHLVRSQSRVHRPDGFVRILSAALAFVHAGFSGQEIRPQVLADPVFGRLSGLVGNAHRVRTHIGDERRSAPPFQFHALVEALGHGHGPFGVEAEPVACFLLQSGGDERRARMALAFLLGDVFHNEGLPGDAFFQFPGVFGIAEDGLGLVHFP